MPRAVRCLHDDVRFCICKFEVFLQRRPTTCAIFNDDVRFCICKFDVFLQRGLTTCAIFNDDVRFCIYKDGVAALFVNERFASVKPRLVAGRFI